MRVVGSNLTQGSSSSFLWKGRAVLGVVDLFDLPCISTYLVTKELRHATQALHNIKEYTYTVPLSYTACFMFSEACIEPIRKILRISLWFVKIYQRFTTGIHRIYTPRYNYITQAYTVYNRYIHVTGFCEGLSFWPFWVAINFRKARQPDMPNYAWGEHCVISQKFFFLNLFISPSHPLLTLSLPIGSAFLEYRFFRPSKTGFCCPKNSLWVLTRTSIISRFTFLGHLSGVIVIS